MCNNICGQFRIQQKENNYYCQECAKYIPEKHITKENKANGRKRCNCCNGLVRNKSRIFTKKLFLDPSLQISN